MFNHKIDKVRHPLKFYGNYRGEVVDVEDPLKVGRIRVRVFGVYDDLEDEEIPWAIFADPFMGGNKDVGGFWIPDEEDHVWVFFEEGCHMHPVFWAGAPAQPHMPDEKIPTEYPRNRVFKTKQGHLIELDDSEGDTRIHVYHRSGTELHMFDNGDMHEIVKGNYTRVVYGNHEEYIAGNKTDYVMGNIDMRAARIDFNLAGPSFKEV